MRREVRRGRLPHLRLIHFRVLGVGVDILSLAQRPMKTCARALAATSAYLPGTAHLKSLTTMMLTDVLIGVVHDAVLRGHADTVAARPFRELDGACKAWAHWVGVEAVAVPCNKDGTPIPPLVISARAASGTSRTF